MYMLLCKCWLLHTFISIVNRTLLGMTTLNNLPDPTASLSLTLSFKLTVYPSPLEVLHTGLVWP